MIGQVILSEARGGAVGIEKVGDREVRYGCR